MALLRTFPMETSGWTVNTSTGNTNQFSLCIWWFSQPATGEVKPLATPCMRKVFNTQRPGGTSATRPGELKKLLSNNFQFQDLGTKCLPGRGLGAVILVNIMFPMGASRVCSNWDAQLLVATNELSAGGVEAPGVIHACFDHETFVSCRPRIVAKATACGWHLVSFR
jgi:hypothetical protein